MGDDVFDGIRRLVDFMETDRITFSFLGGEATILGIDYFQHFEDYFSDINHRSHMQSNMTLLDDEFCEFFKRYNYTVGSSLDGVPAVHNKTRDNSFSDVLRGITLAKEYGILNKILCTITKESMNHIEETFELFALIKTSVHFNAGTPHVRPKDYQDAMLKLFELWYDFGKPFYGIQFTPLLKRAKKHQWHDIVNGVRRACMSSAAQIDWDGNVVMCSQLAGVPEYQIGNVVRDHPLKILSHQNRYDFWRKTMLVREGCKSCELRFICRGGCFFNAYSHKLQYDPYCGGGKRFYRAILDKAGVSMDQYREETTQK